MNELINELMIQSINQSIIESNQIESIESIELMNPQSRTTIIDHT
jgi:hypothetical protein